MGSLFTNQKPLQELPSIPTTTCDLSLCYQVCQLSLPPITASQFQIHLNSLLVLRQYFYFPGGAMINFISRGRWRDTGGGRDLGSSFQCAAWVPLSFPPSLLFFSCSSPSLYPCGRQHFPMDDFSWHSPGEDSFPASSVSITLQLTSASALFNVCILTLGESPSVFLPLGALC